MRDIKLFDPTIRMKCTSRKFSNHAKERLVETHTIVHTSIYEAAAFAYNVFSRNSLSTAHGDAFRHPLKLEKISKNCQLFATYTPQAGVMNCYKVIWSFDSEEKSVIHVIFTKVDEEELKRLVPESIKKRVARSEIILTFIPEHPQFGISSCKVHMKAVEDTLQPWNFDLVFELKRKFNRSNELHQRHTDLFVEFLNKSKISSSMNRILASGSELASAESSVLNFSLKFFRHFENGVIRTRKIESDDGNERSMVSLGEFVFGRLVANCNAQITEALAFLNAFPNFISWGHNDVSFEVVEGSSTTRSKIIKVQKKIYCSGLLRRLSRRKSRITALDPNGIFGWLTPKEGGEETSQIVTCYLRVVWMPLSPHLYVMVTLPVLGPEKTCGSASYKYTNFVKDLSIETPMTAFRVSRIGPNVTKIDTIVRHLRKDEALIEAQWKIVLAMQVWFQKKRKLIDYEFYDAVPLAKAFTEPSGHIEQSRFMEYYGGTSDLHESWKEGLLHFRVTNMMSEYEGLRQLSTEYTWFGDCVKEAVVGRVHVSSPAVSSRLSMLTNHEGTLIGKAFNGIICFNLTAESGVDEWINRFPAMIEFSEKFKWFRPMMNSIAMHHLKEAWWGIRLRIFAGTLLIVGNLVTDGLVIREEVGNSFLGPLTSAMVLLNGFAQSTITFRLNSSNLPLRDRLKKAVSKRRVAK